MSVPHITSQPSTASGDLLVTVDGIATTLRNAAKMLTDLATENVHLRATEAQLVGDALEFVTGSIPDAFGLAAPESDPARTATEVHLGASKAWPVEVHFPALGRFAARLSVSEAHTLIDQLNDKIHEHAANGGLL
ncbi:hypothetical protein EEB13_05365 [Rhodococcus sp. WS3]|uniref:hypothetical protein n=1 Tax=Rhodococcus sp. WS3 TaxID=2486271 RepID=UPI0011443A63|nr:hypothetical protein [Rhodococcus sp. WS3]ROZ49354.1 hypothetical protein EEB13_05365 [Rhodococcus sp. WS3]